MTLRSGDRISFVGFFCQGIYRGRFNLLAHDNIHDLSDLRPALKDEVSGRVEVSQVFICFFQLLKIREVAIVYFTRIFAV